MLHKVHVFPIIKPCATHGPLTHRKSDRMHHMKAHVDPDTEPPDVAGILWDLWMVKDHVKRGIFSHGQYLYTRRIE
jgi:hypothetical protein